MGTHVFAGWFALLSGVVVIISAVAQIRDGDLAPDEARGQLVLAAGLLIAGLGIGFIAPPTGPRIAILGIVGLAAGLLVQERYQEPR
ncbi:MAG: hypothetical protein GX539_14905 [Candidatus Cloacimonetes bacterium]|jgi:uncharacterized membrane protein|nr:hypothetical protein [Candidatus Cloacimonadota bacterium]